MPLPPSERLLSYYECEILLEAAILNNMSTWESVVRQKFHQISRLLETVAIHEVFSNQPTPVPVNIPMLFTTLADDAAFLMFKTRKLRILLPRILKKEMICSFRESRRRGAILHRML